MDIIRRILLLLIAYVLIVSLNIVSFGYLYYKHDSIAFSDRIPVSNRNINNLPFQEAVYFSGITYFTIGYGDITAVDGIGKFLTILQGFSGIIVNSTFTGMFVYYLVKRSKNILITNRIFIRYKESTKRFYLSVRVGNKGRALVNVNRVLEIFLYENDVRNRRFHLSQEYYYFEKLLYWDIDLHAEENKELLNYLKLALFNNENILIRVSIIGTDIEAGELMFVSKYYTNHSIQFIKEYVGLYKWKGHQRTEINWKDFQKIYKLDHDLIENFRNI